VKIEEDVRISLGARKAAAVVDAILHLRVVSADGSALMSVRPECASRLVREYSVLVLGSASGRDRTPPGQRRIFMSTRDAGMSVDEALKVLGNWSRERQR